MDNDCFIGGCDMKNNVVTKSNTLVEAKYKLNLEEQKMILIFVSQINNTDEDFKSYYLKVKDYQNLTENQNDDMYKILMRNAKGLMSKPLELTKEKEILILNWFTHVRYKSGQIEVSFHPELKPYLLSLKGSFTSYSLKNIIQFKSAYSIRIYELLKQYETIGSRTIEIEKLREYLGISKELYPKYSNFKQKVLKTSQDELFQNADIQFNYEEIKKSRKVDKLKFLIQKNGSCKIEENSLKEEFENGEEQITLEQENATKELQSLIEKKMTKSELLSIFHAANGDMDLIKRRYEVAQSKRNLDNFVGFMVWACKEPEERFRKLISKGKSKFNNFVGRIWDYEEIERLEMQKLINDTKKM